MKRLLLSLATLFIGASSAWSEAAPQFLGQWGQPAGGRFHFPFGLSVSSSGLVYVADHESHRIQVFDASGNFVRAWGSLGYEGGLLAGPVAIGVSGVGDFVYVGSNGRVVKFTNDGNYLSSWGGWGTGDGQFQSVNDVDSDAFGNVYVVDAGNYRIQKFDANGVFQCKWGSQGTDTGQFDFPQGVAVGAGGYVYVTDGSNNRVQVFDEYGTYLDQWGSIGTGPGQFIGPNGITTDSSGNVYVTDSGNQRVQVFDSSGVFLRSWGGPGSGAGEFSGPWGIDVDSNGKVYVSDWANNRVQRFSSVGGYELEWGGPAADGELWVPEDLALAPDGSVYVIDSRLTRVQRFDSTGGFLTKWGSMGSGSGYFQLPAGIAVSLSGAVYVVDAMLCQVQRFSGNGSFLNSWGTPGIGAGQFTRPQGIAVAPTGEVYVADVEANRIQRFDANGGYLGEWGSEGGGPGQFSSPVDLDVDSGGNVWVLDRDNFRIQKFDRYGVLLGVVALPRFLLASHLSLDATGRIYLSTYSSTVGVTTLRQDGTILIQWGGLGGLPGQFGFPTGIGVDVQGTVYIADRVTSRVQRFGFVDEPRVILVQDIGNDQGKQVRVGFQRSLQDGFGATTPIVQYAIFRRIDALATVSEIPPLVSRRQAARKAGVVTDLEILDAGWDFVGVLPAFGQPEYNAVVPTLADSTIVDGIHWSVFFIRAATANSLVYFDSPPDSGYSIDNLAPHVPQNFVVAGVVTGGVSLTWSPSVDTDFSYFSLYRGVDANFEPGPSNRIAQLVGTSFTHEGGTAASGSYKLGATDHSGNESDFATVALTLSGSGSESKIDRFAARLMTANPTRGRVVIQYDLPHMTAVTIEVFDVAGRLRRAEVRQANPAGRHFWQWDARDASGAQLASGIYWVKVRTPHDSTVLKTLLVR